MSSWSASRARTRTTSPPRRRAKSPPKSAKRSRREPGGERSTAVPLQPETVEGVQPMTRLRRTLVALVVVIVAVAHASPAAALSVGQVIDDTVITTEVKAKLSAEKISNLTKIEVKTEQGIVTLNG